MIPHCLDKFNEDGHIQNFISVAEKDGKEHIDMLAEADKIK